jgi:hypothetical protein
VEEGAGGEGFGAVPLRGLNALSATKTSSRFGGGTALWSFSTCSSQSLRMCCRSGSVGCVTALAETLCSAGHNGCRICSAAGSDIIGSLAHALPSCRGDAVSVDDVHSNGVYLVFLPIIFRVWLIVSSEGSMSHKSERRMSRSFYDLRKFYQELLM